MSGSGRQASSNFGSRGFLEEKRGAENNQQWGSFFEAIDGGFSDFEALKTSDASRLQAPTVEKPSFGSMVLDGLDATAQVEALRVMDNAISDKWGVMDNANSPQNAVSDNAKSNIPAGFRAWANEVREVQAVRSYRGGRTAFNGPCGWWKVLPVHLRSYLLLQVAPDEVDSWCTSRWDAMPRPLRDAIALEARQSVRLLQGCPWL